MTAGLWILLGGLLVIAAIVFWHGGRVKRDRGKLRTRRLDARQRAILIEAFPLWEEIPEDIRADTEGWMHVFLTEMNFEPCGGLTEVTEEMRLAIAAPACLLISRRPQDYYERLRSILVYPDAFTVKDEWGMEDIRLGESWGHGSVVLSWQTVKQGDLNPEDGLNVVLHEFAHQLDQADGAGDGVPELDEPEDYGRWSEAFLPAYDAFCERVNAGKRSVLDDYGAENPAEFFAVATETFFERSKGLKREEPEIYAELVKFYGMDPGEWG
ncbi:zinc-dependent peptidase [Luteolibacter flavescens]|uniref:Zinc-dependent peptidase n=1 Tax=Luteolibacter flavescens TaxID=1859460 RepID=A0ABT3FJH5_9BACT|nr:M90 family metallopeptidase [Luteolibacter flavescens]MCW1883725.1 zinc-dependent peptidase [Luteolibacter flavescens]